MRAGFPPSIHQRHFPPSNCLPSFKIASSIIAARRAVTGRSGSTVVTSTSVQRLLPNRIASTEAVAVELACSYDGIGTVAPSDNANLTLESRK